MGGVSFTGSTSTGSIIASLAGKHIKKCVLELGGADAFLVFPGANLKEAVNLAIKSRLKNSGQSCLSSKRFILHSSVQEEFKSLLLSELSYEQIGDPMNPETTIGPLATLEQVALLHSQFESAIRSGATFLRDWKNNNGNFVNPCVICNMSTSMTCWNEETFGPLFSLGSFETNESMWNAA